MTPMPAKGMILRMAFQVGARPRKPEQFSSGSPRVRYPAHLDVSHRVAHISDSILGGDHGAPCSRLEIR